MKSTHNLPIDSIYNETVNLRSSYYTYDLQFYIQNFMNATSATSYDVAIRSYVFIFSYCVGEKGLLNGLYISFVLEIPTFGD